MSRKKSKAERSRRNLRLRRQRDSDERAEKSGLHLWAWWRTWFREVGLAFASTSREEKPRAVPICRDCGATNDLDASECWLCQRRDWRADPASAAIKPDAGTFDRLKLFSSLETLLIAMALAVVEVGVARLAPGLGVVLLVLLVPAWAITEWKARHRVEPMPVLHKFGLMAGLTIVIPLLLVVSLLIPLFAICAAALSL